MMSEAAVDFAGVAQKEGQWLEMDSQSVDGIDLRIEYGNDTGLYRVTCSRGEQSEVDYFSANYALRFGMDVADSGTASAMAEKLAQKLELKV